MYELDYSSDGVVNPLNGDYLQYELAADDLKEFQKKLKQDRLDKFCNTYIYEGAIFKHIEVRYSPAYLMQILANLAGGDIASIFYDVRGEYAKAKASFVATSGGLGTGDIYIGGMLCPHCQETYHHYFRHYGQLYQQMLSVHNI